MHRWPALSSPTPALFVALAGVFAAAAIVRGLFDPDYFWHLATGRLILDSGTVPTTDPFSFTWFGQRWVPDQWLADLVMAFISTRLGDAALLVLFGIVAAAGLALVAEAMRREGARSVAIIPIVLVAAAGLLPQVTARPQVASFAFLGGLLAILIRARPGSSRWLYLVPLLFLAWANTHGFFIVGLGAGFVYLVATLLGHTAMSSRRPAVLAAGAASVLASMLTPQGPAGLLYALSFGDASDWGARNIAEWQSPNFHDPQFLPFLVLIAIVLAVGVRRAPGWLAVVAMVGLALGLIAIRTIGVGILLILPATIAAASLGLKQPVAERQDAARRWLELGMAAFVGIAVLTFAVARGPVTVDARNLPVAGTRLIAANDPDARVLASYGWGGYVINELHQRGGRVFVDGRMHKYAPDVLEDYLAIVGAEPGWQSLVQNYGVEAILLRPDAVLVKGVAQDAGWCEAYRDEVQVLLMYECLR